jgi:hypothetical protein
MNIMKKQINTHRIGKLLVIPLLTTVMSLSLQGVTYAAQLSDVQASVAPIFDAPASETPVSDVPVSDTQETEVPASETPLSEALPSESPAPDTQISEVPALDAMASAVPSPDTQALKAQELNTLNPSITIDGYYDDWEEMPMGKLTWNNNNGNAHHDVSFIKDDEYIYIYVGMHPHYQSPIPIYAIYLSVNHQTCQLFLGYANAQNTTDWGRPVDLNSNGTYLDLHPFTYWPNYSLGDAAITVAKGNPNDKMEIRINIADLERAMGLREGTINSGSQLELQMPNVGGGSLQLLGTSTGTLLGIVLCIGIVIAVRWRRSYRMRLAQ